MTWIVPIHQILTEDRKRTGGKAFALARLKQGGIQIPETVCVTSDTYQNYVYSTGLRERILMELSRKNFDDMRWEEMWDSSLRIRNMFLQTPIPSSVVAELRASIASSFESKAVVVRSSALEEDSQIASFAGLHESYVNIKGLDSILDHIRLVWASLWSDRALLYRQELGLDVEKSAMAAIVQELVVGERSGVAFGKSPLDESQAVIEAVYGLNQGLVDGTVEPDRWILDRETGKIFSHAPVSRLKAIVPSLEGVRLEPLSPEKADRAPLVSEEIAMVFRLVLKAEELFGSPQDVEWTFRNGVLYALQSRPITTGPRGESDDKRPWYLSLHRSFENLKALRETIEKRLIPEMAEEAVGLSDKNPAELSNLELSEEIARRSEVYQKWVDVYWTDFIPFAHGARLFGQVYNDAMRPSDPYEFMDLLAGGKLASIERNRTFERMADKIRTDEQLAESLRRGDYASMDQEFKMKLDELLDPLGDLSVARNQSLEDKKALVRLLCEMADHERPKKQTHIKDAVALEEEFLSRFEAEQQEYASDLLDLGRASYRLRDDDNIYLGKIEAQMLAALEEGRCRLEKRDQREAISLEALDVVRALKDPGYTPRPAWPLKKVDRDFELKARQILGQPAGPGIAKAKAHVIATPSDLFDFKAGEILVCDAVDPNMTFVVSLSAGIVERRGGMLIHGAIIAREYGLPCVTGVPNATSLIKTGDQLTVDGYLGIVVISRTDSSSNS